MAFDANAVESLLISVLCKYISILYHQLIGVGG